MPYANWIDRIHSRRFAASLRKFSQNAKNGRILAVAAISIPIAAPIIVLAQEDRTGSQITFGLASTLSTTDNKFLAYDDADKKQTTEWTNTLSFGLTRQTQTSEFNLSASTDAQVATGDVETSGIEFGNHNLALSYGHETATGGIDLYSRYVQADLVGLESLIDEDTGEVFTEEDPGTKNTFSNGFSFRHGVGTPFETSLNLSQTSVRYEDTISASYYDRDAWSAVAAATMIVSPVTSLTSKLSYASLEIQDENDTERETYHASLAVDYAMSPIWSSTLSVGYGAIDQTGAASLEDQHGFEYGLDVRRDLPRGHVALGYDRRIANLGARDEIFLSGELNGSDVTLAYKVGWSALEDDDSDLVADVDFVKDLPRGQIALGAAQSFGTDSDGYNNQTSRVSADWNHRVNSLSSFGVSASYSAVDYDNPTSTDTQLRSITARYNRDLTEDWALVGGVRYRHETDDDDGDAKSHTLFLTVSRDIIYKR